MEGKARGLEEAAVAASSLSKAGGELGLDNVEGLTASLDGVGISGGGEAARCDALINYLWCNWVL